MLGVTEILIICRAFFYCAECAKLFSELIRKKACRALITRIRKKFPTLVGTPGTSAKNAHIRWAFFASGDEFTLVRTVT